MEEHSLEELALLVQKCPFRSVQRQKWLTRLIEKVKQEKQWFVSNKDHFPVQFHQTIVEEAKQKVILEMCEGIDKYDPKKSPFIHWIKFLLERRYKDYRLEYLGIKRRQQNNEDVLIYMIFSEEIPERSDQEQSDRQFVKRLIDFIEQDETGILEKTHLPNCPETNMKEILLKRLDGKKWRELGELWNISPKTIESFFRRHLEDLKPFFETYFDRED